MSDGWEIRTDLENVAIDVPPGTKVDQESEWVPLFRWQDLATGPTILEVEFSAVLPQPRPTDIQSRWVRAGGNKTKRHVHPVGTIKAWSAVETYLEYVTATDLPMEFQLWQKGTAALTIVKIVPKAFNPAAYIAERMKP